MSKGRPDNGRFSVDRSPILPLVSIFLTALKNVRDSFVFRRSNVTIRSAGAIVRGDGTVREPFNNGASCGGGKAVGWLRNQQTVEAAGGGRGVLNYAATLGLTCRHAYHVYMWAPNVAFLLLWHPPTVINLLGGHSVRLQEWEDWPFAISFVGSLEIQSRSIFALIKRCTSPLDSKLICTFGWRRWRAR
jgi:hypothetical protein